MKSCLMSAVLFAALASPAVAKDVAAIEACAKAANDLQIGQWVGARTHRFEAGAEGFDTATVTVAKDGDYNSVIAIDTGVQLRFRWSFQGDQLLSKLSVNGGDWGDQPAWTILSCEGPDAKGRYVLELFGPGQSDDGKPFDMAERQEIGKDSWISVTSARAPGSTDARQWVQTIVSRRS